VADAVDEAVANREAFIKSPLRRLEPARSGSEDLPDPAQPHVHAPLVPQVSDTDDVVPSGPVSGANGLYDVFLRGGQMLLVDPTYPRGQFLFTAGTRAEGIPSNLVARVDELGAMNAILWTTQVVPIVTDAVAEVIETMTPGAVQWVPVMIEGYPEESRHIMNPVHLLTGVIDYDRSQCTYWREGTEKAGQVSGIYPLRLRQDVEPEYDIFRLGGEGSSYQLIVTGRLKTALDERGLTGAAYTQLT